MTETKQNTPEWLEAKQSKISASEIFSLVLHYCRAELERMGFDLKEERSFRTVQELFLKVKFGAKFSNIDPIHSEFGQGMEPYIAYRLGQEPEIANAQVKIERSKDFIINEPLHPLAACSPDGFLYCLGSSKNPGHLLAGSNLTEYSIEDFDKTTTINCNYGFGALELKTANYFANFGSEKGSRLNYIFQLQFQMMVMELKWGCLAVLMPKEKEFDDPFFKGKTLEKVNQIQGFRDRNLTGLNEDYSNSVDECYDLKYYIYPELPAFQEMIMKALNAFQSDLNGYSEGKQECFPRNSEDLAGLQREKALWAQLWPSKFGSLEIKPESKLDRLLNENSDAREAVLFANQDKLKIENEINQLIQFEGLGKYCELKGSQNRLLWDKNGSMRFYKVKA